MIRYKLIQSEEKQRWAIAKLAARVQGPFAGIVVQDGLTLEEGVLLVQKMNQIEQQSWQATC